MKLKTLFVAIIAAALGYSGYWLYLSSNMGVFLNAAQEKMADQGMAFSFSGYTVSGFPYRLEVDLENVIISAPSGPVGWSFQADQMEAVFHPWNFTHVILFSTRGVVSWGEDFTLTPTTSEMSIHTSGENSLRFSWVMTEVVVGAPYHEPFPETLSNLNIHIRQETTDLDFFLDGQIREGKAFSLLGSFKGGLPEMTPTQLQVWRETGGLLEIENFHYQDQQEILDTSGSFGLDDHLRPVGGLEVKTNSPGGALSLFQVFGLISAEEASGARFFLEALPLQGSENGTLSFPVAAQGGNLFIGPFLVRQLPPVIQE